MKAKQRAMRGFVRSARVFCSAAIAASILFQIFGFDNDLFTMGASSAAGFGTLVAMKKLALLV